MRKARELIEQKERIRCREGWIFYRPLSGNRFYVTATGYRAQTVSAVDLRGYVRELIQALGGQSPSISESMYDVDDPLEKPEYPLGFIARIGNESREWRFDGKFGYIFSAFWPDDFTQKPRSGKNLGYVRVEIDQADTWIKNEMQKWRDAGWQVEEI